MAYDYSVVLICPIASLADVNAASVIMGHSNQEFTVPLSPTGTAPATHYGLHTWSRANFQDIVTTKTAQEISDLYPALSRAQVSAIKSALLVSSKLASQLRGRAHLLDLLQRVGLQIIEGTQ